MGTGPNTQQGAVAGGFLGALAGAILGNNSRSHNALAGAVVGGTAGAIAGGTIGNSIDQANGTIYPSSVAAQTNLVVREPPPPPPLRRAVVVPQPAVGTVWIPGCWEYGPQGYVWIVGRWVNPPPRRYRYVAPHWRRHGHGYIYVRGYWD